MTDYPTRRDAYPYKSPYDAVINSRVNTGYKRALDEIKSKEEFSNVLENMTNRDTGQYSGDGSDSVKKTHRSDEN